MSETSLEELSVSHVPSREFVESTNVHAFMQEHGKPFRPREALFVDEFPKTQSGKIIRRAIAAVYSGDDLGDLSSIENPEALDEIRNAR